MMNTNFKSKVNSNSVRSKYRKDLIMKRGGKSQQKGGRH